MYIYKQRNHQRQRRKRHYNSCYCWWDAKL